jgi:hypothetical protein
LVDALTASPLEGPADADTGRIATDCWTVVASDDGIRFSNDDIGRGIFVGSDTTVNPF